MRWVKLILVALSICYQLGSSHVIQVDIVEKIYRRLFLDCILIEYPDEFYFDPIGSIAKELYSRGLRTSIVNLQNMQQIISETRCDRPLLVHLSPEKTIYQSLSFSRWDWFHHPTWLVFTSSTTRFAEPILQRIHELPLAINPRILVARLSDSSIEEWWKVTKERHWEREQWSYRGFVPGQRNHFRGITFRIGCGMTNTYTSAHYFPNNTFHYIGRYFGRVLYLFQEILQFEYCCLSMIMDILFSIMLQYQQQSNLIAFSSDVLDKVWVLSNHPLLNNSLLAEAKEMPLELRRQLFIKYVVSKEFGDLNKTTNSTGLLNNLIRGDIDLAAFSLVRTPERAKAFHFFYDLNSASISVFIKKPSELEMGWRDYLGIFDSGMWTAVIITIILNTLLDGVFFWALKSKHVAKRTRWDLTETLLLMIGTICCTQAHARIPNSYAGRMLLLTICILSLIISNSYNGFLTAIVTIERFVLPFDNLEDLAKNKHYVLSTSYPSTTYEIFQNSEKNVLQRLFEGPMRHPKTFFPNSSRIGLKKLCRKHNAAFITYDFLLKVVKTACPLATIPERIMLLSSSMAVPFNSTYLRYFNEIIRFGQESGVFKKLLSSKVIENSAEEDHKFDSVVLEDVYFQFSILISGHILAILFLFIEILRQKLRV